MGRHEPAEHHFRFEILKGISGDESLLVVAQVLVKVLLVAIVYGQHNLRWCEASRRHSYPSRGVTLPCPHPVNVPNPNTIPP